MSAMAEIWAVIKNDDINSSGLIWTLVFSSFQSPVFPPGLASLFVEFLSLVVVESVLASDKIQYSL